MIDPITTQIHQQQTNKHTQLHCPNQCTIPSSDIENSTAATTANKNTVGSATSQQQASTETIHKALAQASAVAEFTVPPDCQANGRTIHLDAIGSLGANTLNFTDLGGSPYEGPPGTPHSVGMDAGVPDAPHTPKYLDGGTTTIPNKSAFVELQQHG